MRRIEKGCDEVRRVEKSWVEEVRSGERRLRLEEMGRVEKRREELRSREKS